MTKKTVLIVDDEPHVIRVMRMALERAGYSVDSALDGDEALKKLAQGRPDVMISDLQMRRTGGRVLCESARQLYPEEKFLILVMTSMTAIDEREWVKRLANTEFLEKPLSPRRLLARLELYFNAEAQLEASHG